MIRTQLLTVLARDKRRYAVRCAQLRMAPRPHGAGYWEVCGATAIMCIMTGVAWGLVLIGWFWGWVG